MVIKGDLSQLRVAKIRRNLVQFCVCSPSPSSPRGSPSTYDTVLGYRGKELEDDMIGAEFGLVDGATLQLYPRSEWEAHSSREGIEASKELQAPSSSSRSKGESTAQSENVRLKRELAHLRSLLAQPSPRDAVKTRKETSGHGGWETVETICRRNLRAVPNTIVTNEGRFSFVSLSGAMEWDEHQEALVQCEAVLNSHQLTSPVEKNMSGRGKVKVCLQMDLQAERIILSSKVSSSGRPLPTAPELRGKLYELLLMGGLMGREVCGGGFGLHMPEGTGEDAFVVLSTSLFMKYADDSVLPETLPRFVATVIRWRALLKELY